MSDVVIKAEALGKKYIIGHQAENGSYLALRDVLMQNARGLWHKTRDLAQGKPLIMGDTLEEVWALKDVSFEIRRGEAVGIIGRNGAGKSTLLKILSRITELSAGRVTIKGRVASLLEVGTGFHPELTGRENIYLNGAVLGMGRAEINRKFDEIVAFSEVEKFLDTPVKRYSSGMYVRLAFAVAAHLEPEILVVDEVLAVGDAAFQKKCLGMLDNVSKGGRTVLFVSHNMGAIQQLCSRCILLDGGQKILDEHDVDLVVRRYFDGMYNKTAHVVKSFSDETLTLLDYGLCDADGSLIDKPVPNTTNLYLFVEFNLKQLDPAFNIGYIIYTSNGHQLFWSYSTDSREDEWPTLKIGNNRLRAAIPRRLLNEGEYSLRLMASLHWRKWIINPEKDGFVVPLVIQGGLSDSPYWYSKRPGLLAPVLKWDAY